MKRVVTERLRLTRSESRLLRRLAAESKSAKSEILREGLQLVNRVRMRQKNLKRLLEAAQVTGENEPKIRLRP